MKKSEKLSIGVLGLWHLGCVYTASFAKLGFKVLGFDEDKKIINDLKNDLPPIFEPELTEIIKKHQGKNLSFSSSIKEVLKDKKYIFITYDLPVNAFDQVQIGIIKKTFSNIAKFISPHSTIVISSQVPVGTSRNLVNLLKKKNILNPKVIYFPENLRLGNALKTFFKPSRIILGSDNKKAMKQFQKDFKFNCEVITMDLESAEMSKHALNSYLATCISLSSELSDLSEKLGANMLDIAKALKTDKRVGIHAPINPGLGFAGGTLGRDIQVLRKIAKEKKYQTKLLDAVYAVNKDRSSVLLEKISSLFPSLKKKNIGLLGLTYKPNTDTLRRSMALELALLLTKKGCHIKAYDPAIKKKIATYPFIKIQQNLETFFKDLDLIILMTEWPQFKKIDVAKVSSFMRNRNIIDTKNFLEPKVFLKNGFTYLGMGVGLK